MKSASVKQLKDELKHLSSENLISLSLRLARFKKENKELLTYLLFEAHNESNYIKSIKNELDEEFQTINTDSYFYIKKSVRRILRNIKKYIRYSQNKETEVELLLYFCIKLKNFTPTIKKNVMLTNLYNRQILFIKKTVATMHEDLQYDYHLQLEELTN